MFVLTTRRGKFFSPCFFLLVLILFPSPQLFPYSKVVQRVRSVLFLAVLRFSPVELLFPSIAVAGLVRGRHFESLSSLLVPSSCVLPFAPPRRERPGVARRTQYLSGCPVRTIHPPLSLYFLVPPSLTPSPFLTRPTVDVENRFQSVKNPSPLPSYYALHVLLPTLVLEESGETHSARWKPI